MSTNVFDNLKIKNILTSETTVDVLNTVVSILNIGGNASVNIGDVAYVNDSTTTSNPSGSKVTLKCPLKLPPLTSNIWKDSGSSSLNGFGVSNLMSLTTSGAKVTTIDFYATKIGGMIYLYSPGLTFTPTVSQNLSVTVPTYLTPKYSFVFPNYISISSTATISKASFNGSVLSFSGENGIPFTLDPVVIYPFTFVYPTTDSNWGT